MTPRLDWKEGGLVGHPVFKFTAPDLFLDLGPGDANSEAWAARKSWPTCKIVGVEPSYIRFNGLKKQGDYPGHLLHKAIAERAGEITGFVESRKNMFVYPQPDNEDSNKEVVTVPAVTLDDLYEEYAPNNDKSVFIWADIEGMELLALRGATKLLESGNVIGLNLELWPRNATNPLTATETASLRKRRLWANYTGSRCTADQVVSFLRNYGFSYRAVVEIMEDRKVLISEENDPGFENKEWFGDWIFTPEGFDIESLYTKTTGTG